MEFSTIPEVEDHQTMPQLLEIEYINFLKIRNLIINNEIHQYNLFVQI